MHTIIQSQSGQQPNYSDFIAQNVLSADNDATYRRWRDFKLDNYITDPKNCLVTIEDPTRIDSDELRRLKQIVERNNFVIYEYTDHCHNAIEGYQSICRELGLTRSVSNPESDENDVTTICDHAHESSDNGYRSRYIPYTNHALNWHTDGYYNTGKRCVRAFVLHCLASAASGGETRLLDHEIAYILLREKNPDWAQALCDPGCFTIPANVQQGKVVRRSFTGPVFSSDPQTGALYARYTERKFNVLWKDIPQIQQGVLALKSILDEDNRWVTKIKLRPGQGIICNNVLHNRAAFSDDPECARRFYRIRFSQRIHFADV